jgi:hypothetical protein
MCPLPYRALAVFLVALVLGTGCTSKQYHPRIQLTEGDTYALVIDKTDTSTMRINGASVRESHDIYRLYDIVVKEARENGGALLSITYKSSRIGMSITANGYEVSSFKNEKGRNLYEDIADIVEGHTFTVEIGAEGTIQKVTGLDEMATNIKSQINVRDYFSRMMLNAEQLKDVEDRFFSMESPERVALILGEVFSVLPNTPIAIGETWNAPRLEDQRGDMFYDREITAVLNEGNRLHAKLSAIMDSHPTAKIQVDGEATSELTIDLDSGLVTNLVLRESLSSENASNGVTNIRTTVTTTMELLKM